MGDLFSSQNKTTENKGVEQQLNNFNKKETQNEDGVDGEKNIQVVKNDRNVQRGVETVLDNKKNSNNEITDNENNNAEKATKVSGGCTPRSRMLDVKTDVLCGETQNNMRLVHDEQRRYNEELKKWRESPFSPY